MPSGAETLLKLFAQGGGGGDQLNLRALQGRRASELEGQIGADAGAQDPVSAANVLRKGLFLKGLERDMAQDPDMGAAAQQRVADIEGQNTGYQDYVDPQNTQMRNEQFQQKYDLATAPARIQGQFAVEAANNKAQAQNDALTAMLSAGGDGRSMSLSGVGSIGAEPRPQRGPSVPAGVQNRLVSARKAMEAKQGNMFNSLRGMLGMGDGGASQEFLQARRNFVGSVAPELVDVLEQAAPNFQKGMSPEQKIDILNQMLGGRQVNVDEGTLYRVLAEY